MTPARSSLFVMGRLKAIAPREQRRGHSVRARRGELVLDSSFTDSSGRFLVEWDDDGRRGRTTIELLTAAGEVCESIELDRGDLDSPPVVVFSGEGVVGSRRQDAGPDLLRRFEAEGDAPVCVASSCQEVTLSWTSRPGARVALMLGSEVLRDLVNSERSTTVAGTRSSRYVLRTWQAGREDGQHHDVSVEVRRYRSLSLVMDGNGVTPGSSAEFGASISCPAGDQGLSVEVASSDTEIVPRFEIRIPPGAKWASTRVRVGRKRGVVRATGSARGFARDEVTFAVS